MLHKHTSTHLSAHASTHAFTCVTAHVSAHMSAHKPARMSLNMYVHMSTHMSTRMSTRTFCSKLISTYVSTHVSTHVCVPWPGRSYRAFTASSPPKTRSTVPQNSHPHPSTSVRAWTCQSFQTGLTRARSQRFSSVRQSKGFITVVRFNLAGDAQAKEPVVHSDNGHSKDFIFLRPTNCYAVNKFLTNYAGAMSEYFPSR